MSNSSSEVVTLTMIDEAKYAFRGIEELDDFSDSETISEFYPYIRP
jgi:hypothetical protein